jgi:hypothetical protein
MTAYISLATRTLSSPASSITFSNIPNTYRDLVLIVSGTATSNGYIGLRYNGDSGSNYSRIGISGASSNGSSAGFSSTDSIVGLTLWRTSNAMLRLDVLDYSANNKLKTGISRGGGGGMESVIIGHRWNNTSPITSLNISHVSSQMATGTTLSLYGVLG